jgi:YD repeat-containing protein
VRRGIVILTYTLAEKEYVDAQRAFNAHLARRRLLFRMTLPVAFGAAVAGSYSFFVVNNLGWGIGLCLASVYLLVGRMFWLQRRVRRAIEEHPERLGPFQVELTNHGIKFNPGGSEFSWPVLLRYFETRDLFLLLGPDREFCILPKRVFPMGDMLQWTERLRAELKGKGNRENPDALLLRLMATWAVVALFVVALFTGSIHDLLRPTFRRARARTRTGAGVSNLPPAKTAPISELKGVGTVYFVPLSKAQSVLSTDLLSYYRKKYGLDPHVLAPVPLPSWTTDETRHQLIAEELVEAIKRAYPRLANDPDAILLGVTDEDMYIAEMNWSYAFSWRQEERFAIVSTARLDPVFDKEPEDPKLVEARTRKMITKDIGLLYYRLQPSYDYSSALYDSIDGVDDLDDMGEDFLTSDTEVRAERRLQDGDPCFTIRHYYAAEKTRADSGMLSGCSGDAKQLNVEIMEVDLRCGLFLDRRTEFYIPDRIPLEFTRVLRTQDSRSRAFGIGGTHNLNIFPVGNTWPFTWMDLILADGGRVHYKRSNWGFGYWDATYSETSSGGSEFSGSKVSWDWPGWKLAEPGARSYYFSDSGPGQRPEQSALIAIGDYQGHRLSLVRDPAGNLIRAHSPVSRSFAGSELDFEYDEKNRIMHAWDRNSHHIDYSYDPGGGLAHVKELDGQVTDYSYDTKNRMIKIMQNGNLILRNDYDTSDRVIRETLPDGRAYTFKYWLDDVGHVIAVDVNDSAGLTWTINMSGEDQYTMKAVRNQQTSAFAHSPGRAFPYSSPRK